MNYDFQVGELFCTTTGRTVEILAYDEIDQPDDVYAPSIEVIAYRFVGGSMVHLRPVHTVLKWTKVQTG